MKAPDKIYVREYQDGSYTTCWDRKPPEEESISMKAACYIRKDALLEWAKETYLTENASAIRKVCFKQLIEKLMSM